MTRSPRKTGRVAVVALACALLIPLAVTGTSTLLGPAAAPVGVETPPVAPQPGDCRDFQRRVEIAGEALTVTGRACLGNDGRWTLVAP